MAKVLFVDDRPSEINRLWQQSGCESNHELLPVEPFETIERTCQIVHTCQPDIVLVGYGLGKPNITGADVVLALRKDGYRGQIVANSGGGPEQFKRDGVQVDASTNRNFTNLRNILEKET